MLQFVTALVTSKPKHVITLGYHCRSSVIRSQIKFHVSMCTGHNLSVLPAPLYMMLCAIWYQSHNLKKCEKHTWRSVTFCKVIGFSLHFTKSNTPLWVFFTFFILYKWYQIAQSVSQELVYDIKISGIFKLRQMKYSHLWRLTYQ